MNRPLSFCMEFRALENQKNPGAIWRTSVPRSGIFLQFAEHCSAIWDFSSFCGTGQAISSAQTEKSLFCGTQFRDPGFFFSLRNIVPRYGFFLRLAEQDRRILPLKGKILFCGTPGQFRDPGFFFSLRNIVPRSGIFLQFAEQDRRFLPLKRNNLCFAEHSSAIRDFSSFCGTLFRDLRFFFVLRNRTGDFFRSNGIISVLRNTVPRSGIFLQFAEQDRRFLPLKRNNLCFAEHSSAIWDFSSFCGTGQAVSSAQKEKSLFCGTQFRDPGFFFSLRNIVPRSVKCTHKSRVTPI